MDRGVAQLVQEGELLLVGLGGAPEHGRRSLWAGQREKGRWWAEPSAWRAWASTAASSSGGGAGGSGGGGGSRAARPASRRLRDAGGRDGGAVALAAAEEAGEEAAAARGRLPRCGGGFGTGSEGSGAAGGGSSADRARAGCAGAAATASAVSVTRVPQPEGSSRTEPEARSPSHSTTDSGSVRTMRIVAELAQVAGEGGDVRELRPQLGRALHERARDFHLGTVVRPPAGVPSSA